MTSSGKCRVILADDHLLLRHGLKRILAEKSDIEVVGEAGDGLELLRLLNEVQPDIVLLDISMPKVRGIETIPEIKRMHPNAKIVILTMHKDQEYVTQAITAGADGYLLKEDAEKDLFDALERVLQGKLFVSQFLAEQLSDDWVQILRGRKEGPSAQPLSNRELEILKLIAEGRSSKEIGDLLCISARTVERHRSNIMDKLNMRKTADLVRYAFSKGLL